jgi:hypothetical protein
MADIDCQIFLEPIVKYANECAVFWRAAGIRETKVATSLKKPVLGESTT